ncbi:MAG: hypothetical protein V9G20_02635 [Candidatus Promineifilaceae bacterium]
MTTFINQIKITLMVQNTHQYTNTPIHQYTNTPIHQYTKGPTHV